MNFHLDPVTPEQTPTLMGLIRELAAYEQADHLVRAKTADLQNALFGSSARIFADLAMLAEEIVGCAVTYEIFSTFEGKPKLYIEDLYVRQNYRGQGIGRAIISQLAARCVEKGYGALQWSVLEWNQPSIVFYRRIGAEISNDRLACKISGTALHSLVNSTKSPKRAA